MSHYINACPKCSYGWGCWYPEKEADTLRAELEIAHKRITELEAECAGLEKIIRKLGFWRDDISRP